MIERSYLHSLERRYQPVEDPLIREDEQAMGPIYKEIFQPSQPHPTVLSARITKHLITALGSYDCNRERQFHAVGILVLNSFLLCAIQIFASGPLANKNITALVCLSLSILVELILIFALTRQPKNKKSLYFEVTNSTCRSHVPFSLRRPHSCPMSLS